MYSVYVLQNAADKFYIGISDNVVRRLADHNSGKSSWSRIRGPWSLSVAKRAA
jgi:putative endonuclease